MREAAFLVLLLLGVVALLAGVMWTRASWRADVPPYGRGTRFLDVTLHPERYARADSLRAIRSLNLVGALSLACAMGLVVFEIVATVVRR